MKKSNLILIASTAVTMTFCFMIPKNYADDVPSDLSQEVSQLKQKISQLEKTLASRDDTYQSPYSEPSEWDPFYEMNLMKNQINRMFQDSMFRGGGEFHPGNFIMSNSDLSETDKEYIYRINIPGMEKDNINIEVKEGKLFISAKQQKESEYENQNNSVIQKQQILGYYSNVLPLPENADQDHIKADYKNGVLSVELKKLASGKVNSKIIPING